MPKDLHDQQGADDAVEDKAQEPTPGDDTGTDDAQGAADTDQMPTAEEIAAALAAIRGSKADDTDDEDQESDDDGDDTEDTVDADSKLLAKVRKTNREAKKQRDRAVTAERKLAQYDAAAAAGLPLDMAARLQGNTPEELAADATKLLELVGSPHRRIPGAPPATGDGATGSYRQNPQAESDIRKIADRIYGR